MDNFSKWPCRPILMPGESFSSWFSRLALANGVSPSELYRVALPGGRMYRGDLDRIAPENLLQNLSDKTLVPILQLQQSTFRAWDDTLIADDDGLRKLPWLPPSASWSAKRSFGYQFCPACLCEDTEPFFRLAWRLRFTTTCQVHRIQFHDRCPACSAPIQPLYSNTSNPSVVCCSSCGFDLRNSPGEAVKGKTVINREARYRRVIEEKWYPLRASKPLHAVPFFDLLWRLYRLVACGRFAHALRAEIGSRLPGSTLPTSVPTIKAIERHNPSSRAWLLSLTDELLNNWPESFIHPLEKVGMVSGHLLKEKKQLPFAFVSAVESNLSKPNRTYASGEVHAVRDRLLEQGCRPTMAALKTLSGHKIKSFKDIAEPSRNTVPYGTHRYWKLDGISPDTRRKAKRAAKRDGDNVGPWVERALTSVLARHPDLDTL